MRCDIKMRYVTEIYLCISVYRIKNKRHLAPPHPLLTLPSVDLNYFLAPIFLAFFDVHNGLRLREILLFPCQWNRINIFSWRNDGGS